MAKLAFFCFDQEKQRIKLTKRIPYFKNIKTKFNAQHNNS